MHLFTGLQFLGLVVLWVVKSSSLALAFPFFVVGMVPYRLTFKLMFNQRELEAVSLISKKMKLRSLLEKGRDIVLATE